MIPPMKHHFQENQQKDAREFVDILERIRFKMQDDQADRWGAERPVVEQMARVRALAESITESLTSSSGSQGALFEYRQRFLEDLKSRWDLLSKAANTGVMKVDDLPEVVKGWFFQKGTYLLRIFPGESVFEEHALGRFVREIQSVDAEVIGNPVSLYVFADAFKAACVKASIYAVLAIFVLLTYSFRS